MASIEIGGDPVCPPFIPFTEFPSMSLLFAPSINKELKRLFCPAKDITPSPVTFACGTNRTRSWKLRLIVGIDFNVKPLMFVSIPLLFLSLREPITTSSREIIFFEERILRSQHHQRKNAHR